MGLTIDDGRMMSPAEMLERNRANEESTAGNTILGTPPPTTCLASNWHSAYQSDGRVPGTIDELREAHAWDAQEFEVPPITGHGDPGGTFSTEMRIPFEVYPTGDRERGQATITRTLADTSVSSQIQADEFEIIAHDNGRYTLVLPGVTDLSNPDYGLDEHNQTARDLDQFAVPSSTTSRIEDNHYAELVRDYVLANVPRGSDVMIVGHSFGADAALDLASDPAFNNEQTGVNVTHVVAAAYYSQPQIDDVQDHTQVLVLQNRSDAAVIAEGFGYTPTEAQHYVEATVDDIEGYAGDAVGDLRDGITGVYGPGSSIVRGDVRDAWGRGQDLATSVGDLDFPSVSLPTPGALDLLSDGVTEPNDHTVVARFSGGRQGAGHHQQNYIDYINGNEDPAVQAFYASVAEAGYTERGDAFAVDVSVDDPNFEPTYPGASHVERVVDTWNGLPGNDVLADVADRSWGAVSGVGSSLWGARDEFADVVTDARDRIRDRGGGCSCERLEYPARQRQDRVHGGWIDRPHPVQQRGRRQRTSPARVRGCHFGPGCNGPHPGGSGFHPNRE